MKFGRRAGYYKGVKLKPVPDALLLTSGLYTRLIEHGFSAAIAIAECRARSHQGESID